MRNDLMQFENVHNCVTFVCSEGYEWVDDGLEIDDMLASLYFKNLSWGYCEKFGMCYIGKIGQTVEWIFGPTIKIEIKYPILIAKSNYGMQINVWQQFPTLYKKFASLTPSKDKILEFANSYGCVKNHFFLKKTTNNNGIKSYSVNNILVGCAYEEWQEEIFQMFINIKLLEIIQQYDEFEVDKIVQIGEDLIDIWLPSEMLPKWVYPCEFEKTFDEKTQELLKNVFLQNEGKYKKFCSIVRGKYHLKRIQKSYFQKLIGEDTVFEDWLKRNGKIQILKYVLMENVNEKITGNVTMRNLINADIGEINEFIFVDDLLTALYLQLNNDFLKKRSLRRCLYCGEYFVPTKENQYYCPEEISIIVQEGNRFKTKTMPTGKHCKKYDYTKNRSKIFEMYKQGKTIEEIALLTGRPIEQIRRWLKKNK